MVDHVFPRTFIINPCFLISDVSVVFSVFYKLVYTHMRVILVHFFYKCVYFLHTNMGNQIFFPVLLKMF